MLQADSAGSPIFRRALVCAAEASFRARRAEIVAAVVRQAEPGDRAAVRLAREHGLPVEPPPQVLAAHLAQSIERTRTAVATLLAEGGLDVGKDSRVRHALRFIGRMRHATKEAATLVKNNENTSAAENGDAAG